MKTSSFKKERGQGRNLRHKIDKTFRPRPPPRGRPRRRPFFSVVTRKTPSLAFSIHPCSILENRLDTQSLNRGRRTTTRKEYDEENETLNKYLPEWSPIGLGLGVFDNFHASDGFIAARPARLLITASNSVGSTGFAK